jgi:RNA polymerase primary sigma factor
VTKVVKKVTPKKKVVAKVVKTDKTAKTVKPAQKTTSKTTSKTLKKTVEKTTKKSAKKTVKSAPIKFIEKVKKVKPTVTKAASTKKSIIRPSTAAMQPVAPPKNSKGKLCRIVSYEKLEPQVKKMFDIKFGDGYEELIERFTRKSGEYFYAVRFETEDTEYLVKVDVDMDLVGYEEDDIVKDGGDDVDTDVNSIANTVSDSSSDNEEDATE